MAREPTCTLHPEVPLVTYGGARWCRVCEAGRQQLADLLGRWVLFCQWGLVLSVPLCLTTLCFLARPDRFYQGAQPPAFWWRLMFPTAFAAAGVATAAGHATLRRLTRVTRWFHPTHALWDGTLIALLFSLTYAAALLLGNMVFGLSLQAGGVGSWLTHQAPLLLLIGVLAWALPVKWNLVTGDALLPRPPQRNRWTAVYAAWLTLVYLPVQWAMAALASMPAGVSLWLASAGAAVFFVLMTPVVRLALHRTAGYLDPPSGGSVPAKIALVGPPDAGKTVFLTRAYRLLEQGACGKSIRLAPTWESREILSPIIDLLEIDRVWPPDTIRATEIPFSLHYGPAEIVRFAWIDLPGGVFTDPELWAAEAEAFACQLAECDAVALLIDAPDLERPRNQGKLPCEDLYENVTRSLYRHLVNLGEGARPVPLAVILTKGCRAKAGGRHLRAAAPVRQLAHVWWSTAVDNGLTPPPVKVFVTSAVVNGPDGPNRVPEDARPLRSEQCVEPVLWLAAKIVRANMSLSQSAAGCGAHSPLQEAVLWLERT